MSDQATALGQRCTGRWIGQTITTYQYSRQAIVTEKPRASFAACCSAFFRAAAVHFTRCETAIFTSKAPGSSCAAPIGYTRAAAAARRRDELRSKFGCHRPNIERMVRPIRLARLSEWFATNFGAADEPTADYRTPRRRAADSGGAGRTATGIGREKGVERLLLGGGSYLATPTSARNAPSDTPGDRARARHCVSGLFCLFDDLAESGN